MQEGIEAGDAFDPRARNAELHADVTDRRRMNVTVQFLHLAQYLQQGVRVAGVAIQYRIQTSRMYLATCHHEALPYGRHAATFSPADSMSGLRLGNALNPPAPCQGIRSDRSQLLTDHFIRD